MADLDLVTMLITLTTLQEDVRVRREGLISDRSFAAFSDEERALFDEHINIYSQLQNSLASLALLDSLLDPEESGIPALPTFDIPASMLVKLEGEINEVTVSKTLYRASPVATGLGAPLFGDPEPKE